MATVAGVDPKHGFLQHTILSEFGKTTHRQAMRQPQKTSGASKAAQAGVSH